MPPIFGPLRGVSYMRLLGRSSLERHSWYARLGLTTPRGTPHRHSHAQPRFDQPTSLLKTPAEDRPAATHTEKSRARAVQPQIAGDAAGDLLEGVSAWCRTMATDHVIMRRPPLVLRLYGLRSQRFPEPAAPPRFSRT